MNLRPPITEPKRFIHWAYSVGFYYYTVSSTPIGLILGPYNDLVLLALLLKWDIHQFLNIVPALFIGIVFVRMLLGLFWRKIGFQKAQEQANAARAQGHQELISKLNEITSLLKKMEKRQ